MHWHFDRRTLRRYECIGKADRANFGTITPVAAQLKTIGGLAFGLMLPVLAGYIGEAIGDRPALAVGFVGGVIAANGNPDSSERW